MDDDYIFFTNICTFYLCPSMMEGYGHYINEGRILKKVIVTIDKKPMNEFTQNNLELIDSNKKELIDNIIDNKYMSNKFQIYGHYIDKHSFKTKLEKLFSLSKDKIDKMREKNYSNYLNDTDYFIKSFSNVINRTNRTNRTNRQTPQIDLSKYEKKVFSQNGEDGIIQKIFETIGVTNKYYVEFGVEDGTECNTRLLREKGWTGLMLDGSNENLKINLRKEFIDASNIVSLFEKYNTPSKFDLLSVDIDYNDFYVLHKILEKYKPRLIVCEYNGFNGYDEDKIVIYDPLFMWDRTKYYGVSMKSLYNLFKMYNYSIIYCDDNGVNLFAISNNIKHNFPNTNKLNKLYKPLHTDKYHKNDWLKRQYVSSKYVFKNGIEFNIAIKNKIINIMKSKYIMKLKNMYDKNKKIKKWEIVDRIRNKIYNSVYNKLDVSKYDKTQKDITSVLIKNTIN